MYEHNALGYWSGLALCLTKVRSSRARCPATALIQNNVCSIMRKPDFAYAKTKAQISCAVTGSVFVLATGIVQPSFFNPKFKASIFLGLYLT